MANRKRLKKSVKLVTGNLLADCVALNMCGMGNEEEIAQIMTEVIALHRDFVSRISHTEKGNERLFYKKFRQEFTEKVNALSDRIVGA